MVFYQVFLLSHLQCTVTQNRNCKRLREFKEIENLKAKLEWGKLFKNSVWISSKNSTSELLCPNVCLSVCTHQLYLSASMHDLSASPARIPEVLKLQFPDSILFLNVLPAFPDDAIFICSASICCLCASSCQHPQDSNFPCIQLLHMPSSIHSFYGYLPCSVLSVSWHCSASYKHEFYLQFTLTPPPPSPPNHNQLYYGCFNFC